MKKIVIAILFSLNILVIAFGATKALTFMTNELEPTMQSNISLSENDDDLIEGPTIKTMTMLAKNTDHIISVRG